MQKHADTCTHLYERLGTEGWAWVPALGGMEQQFRRACVGGGGRICTLG